MCTVTFIPVKDGFFITSNRDEKNQRLQALPPKMYRVNDVDLLFPKDADAGGTWIALKNNTNAAVLLNGGFVNHVSQQPYKTSRGLILLDILSAACPVHYFSQTNLSGIEPFTLIVLQNGELYECRCNGAQKYCAKMATHISHIWSSVTLYDDVVRKKRQDWFKQWTSKNDNPSQEDIFDFHLFAGDGDGHNDIRMNREGKIFTVSITGIHLNDNRATMSYFDLKDGNNHKGEKDHAKVFSI